MRLGVLIAFGVLSFARLPFPCYGAIDPIEAALEKAKAGDGFSQFRLGNSYDAGTGVAQDCHAACSLTYFELKPRNPTRHEARGAPAVAHL